MKLTHSIIMSTAIVLGACSGVTSTTSESNEIIGPSDIKISGGRLTPEALWAMGRIGDIAVSPDNKKIVYSVAYYSVPQDKSNRELYIMDAAGSNKLQLTCTPYQETGAVWFEDGKKIAYMSNESGTNQVYEMLPNGSGIRQLTNYDGDIEGFKFSPDGKKLLFIAQVKTKPSTAEIYNDLPKATGFVVSDLMYKHWDEWKTTAPHPFVADFDGIGISNIVDILDGEPFESPMKPHGGIEQLTWNTTSDKIAYTCRKKTGLEYAISTNSDIYIYNVNTKTTDNITEENKGYDTNPQYSPSGEYIAWLSRERDGYEADQNRLFIMNLTTGEKKFVSKAFESDVDEFVWSGDSKTIYFNGPWHGEIQIYSLDVATSAIKPITKGMYDYVSPSLFGDKLLAKRHSMSKADEIYAVNMDGTTEQLTEVNKHIYDQIQMGKVESRWIPTTDGKEMLTWIIYPPHFDPNKKYPTLLFCQGGPQSPVSQFWSYRWNMQVMAANDYIVVAPNRRGLPGFGNEWNEQISGDYGGQVMRDYMSAIDAVAKESYVDKEHLGCVGASFGGYSVYWLAGHHDNRFKAFIAHDGIFNMEMQYLETEEKWFANWDMGGPYWDKNNATAQRTFANSPHKFVDKWDTPILCIHGEQDFRILANQAMAAFDAAVMRGVPAELLIYPDENHWVLKPQNGILWQRTFFNWLDRWLKPTAQQ